MSHWSEGTETSNQLWRGLDATKLLSLLGNSRGNYCLFEVFCVDCGNLETTMDRFSWSNGSLQHDEKQLLKQGGIRIYDGDDKVWCVLVAVAVWLCWAKWDMSIDNFADRFHQFLLYINDGNVVWPPTGMKNLDEHLRVTGKNFAHHIKQSQQLHAAYFGVVCEKQSLPWLSFWKIMTSKKML